MRKYKLKQSTLNFKESGLTSQHTRGKEVPCILLLEVCYIEFVFCIPGRVTVGSAWCRAAAKYQPAAASKKTRFENASHDNSSHGNSDPSDNSDYSDSSDAEEFTPR